MTPATQHHDDAYVERNLFLFAVLGVVSEQRRARELVRRLIARSRREGRARQPRALEYALLGIVSFGLTLEHRLGTLARETVPPSPAEGDPESCLRTLLV